MNEHLVIQFTEIEIAKIDEELVAEFTDEADFVGKCVDLLIEAGSYLTVAMCIYPSGQLSWSRDEAVIGGNLVRMQKLVHAILDQTCKHRLETTFVFSRLLFETAVNSIYIMRNPKQEVFSAFVTHALHHEDSLLRKIESNISERGGEILPIEKRMIKSIELMFKISNIERESLPRKRNSDWEGRNLRQRAQDIGLDEVYLGVFSGASQLIHGSWGDLYQHHLEHKNGRFTAKPSFKFPRPQPLEVNAILSVRAVSEFISYLGLFQERKALEKIFNDFEYRVRLLSELHENYLEEK